MEKEGTIPKESGRQRVGDSRTGAPEFTETTVLLHATSGITPSDSAKLLTDSQITELLVSAGLSYPNPGETYVELSTRYPYIEKRGRLSAEYNLFAWYSSYCSFNNPFFSSDPTGAYGTLTIDLEGLKAGHTYLAQLRVEAMNWVPAEAKFIVETTDSHYAEHRVATGGDPVLAVVLAKVSSSTAAIRVKSSGTIGWLFKDATVTYIGEV